VEYYYTSCGSTELRLAANFHYALPYDPVEFVGAAKFHHA